MKTKNVQNLPSPLPCTQSCMAYSETYAIVKLLGASKDPWVQQINSLHLPMNIGICKRVL